MANSTVDADSLAAGHEAALENHRYRLRTGDLVVTAAPNRSTMLVRSLGSAAGRSHYVVNGRVHSYYYHRGGGGDRYSVRRYDGEPLPSIRGPNVSVTGAPTITRTLGRYPHRVARRRGDGWTVLRARIDAPTHVGNRTVYRLDSTILVDRRGIVRSLDRRVLAADGPNATRHWHNVSLEVTELGSATIDRPHWVCLAPERQQRGP